MFDSQLQTCLQKAVKRIVITVQPFFCKSKIFAHFNKDEVYCSGECEARVLGGLAGGVRNVR